MGQKRLLAFASVVMVIMAGLFVFSGETATKVSEVGEPPDALASADTVPMEGWNVVERDKPMGWSVFIWDVYGGSWSDAEKAPGDDGGGNPLPNVPGDEDDLLCWAATDANMLEYTGWGFVSGMDTPDDFLDYYENHVTDFGSTIDYGLTWWFMGYLQTHEGAWSTEDVAGGAFWLDYFLTGPIHVSDPDNLPRNMYLIESNLATNRACGIGIDEIAGDGSHAITVWGVTIDPGKAVDDPARYKGIWVTDSDSHKGTAGAEDYLTYFNVTYDATNEYWYMPNYGAGWSIVSVVGLDVFPGDGRPVADGFISENNGEGSDVTFDASPSSDPDNDALSYRWDFDGDGTWDTDWSTNPTISHIWDDDYVGTAYLQVFDGRLTDMCSIHVEVLNVGPTVSLIGQYAVINEAEVESVIIIVTDPGAHDTFVLTIDWGDGTLEQSVMPLGREKMDFHIYKDDDPSGTPSDNYTIIAQILDKDGGYDSVRIKLIVMDVRPDASIDAVVQPDPNFILPLVHTVEFQGSFSDQGLMDTHTAIWNWGDLTTSDGTVVESSGSGIVTGSHFWNGPGTYIVTLTVLDDDTLSIMDSWTVVVISAQEAIDHVDDYIQALPGSAFGGMNVMEKKAALHAMTMFTLNKVEKHDYIGARSFLLNCVKTMMDGLPMTKNKMNIDWISDPTQQHILCHMIDDIAEYLSLMR